MEAFIHIDSFAGRTKHKVNVIGATPKRFRVEVIDQFVTVATRKHHKGSVLLVPRYAVRDEAGKPIECPDAFLENDHGFFTLTPVSDKAKDWLFAHCNPKPRRGDSLHFDDRQYVQEILVAMKFNAGLVWVAGRVRV